jgi:hypothetical protein
MDGAELDMSNTLLSSSSKTTTSSTSTTTITSSISTSDDYEKGLFSFPLKKSISFNN